MKQELTVKMEELDKRLNKRIDDLDAKLSQRISDVESSLNKRIDDLAVQINELRKDVRLLHQEVSSIKSDVIVLLKQKLFGKVPEEGGHAQQT